MLSLVRRPTFAGCSALHFVTFLFLVCAACMTSDAVAGDKSDRTKHIATRQQTAPRMAPLKGLDLRGHLHRFGEERNTKAVVVVFLSAKCDVSNGYMSRLNQLASKYRRKGVETFGVISDPTTTRAEAAQHREECKLTFPVLFDGSGELRRGFHATHSPQAYVLNERGDLLYRGAIDDRHTSPATTTHYLEQAIKATLAGKPVGIRLTKPVGSHLTSTANARKAADVTFARDIAPIIQANCASCHREGQAAPFELLTYNDVRKRAQQIVEVTTSRYMPPWKPAPDFGHFRNAQRLTSHELTLLEAWEAAGSPEGNPDDLPACPPQPEGWRLGKPDQILHMKEVFHLRASGPDVRRYFVIPSRLVANTLISAIDFHPGAVKAIHHASFFLDTKHAGRSLEDADPEPGYAGFGGPRFRTQGTLQSWFPGRTPQRLPHGTGRLLPRGADIVAEIHYVCTGKEEDDRSTIGLYHASSNSRHLIEEIQVANKQIRIPAGAKRHLETASYTLPVDTYLLDVTPHMHVLGSEFKVVATLPDESTVPLIWIKEWDFNWQSQYAYARPVRLPKGARIDVQAWFDNSDDNILNPNSPPQDVTWGEDSSDEMLICHFQCTCATLDELKILMTDYKRYFDSAQKLERQNHVETHEGERPAFR